MKSGQQLIFVWLYEANSSKFPGTCSEQKAAVDPCVNQSELQAGLCSILFFWSPEVIRKKSKKNRC